MKILNVLLSCCDHWCWVKDLVSRPCLSFLHKSNLTCYSHASQAWHFSRPSHVWLLFVKLMIVICKLLRNHHRVHLSSSTKNKPSLHLWLLVFIRELPLKVVAPGLWGSFFFPAWCQFIWVLRIEMSWVFKKPDDNSSILGFHISWWEKK